MLKLFVPQISSGKAIYAIAFQSVDLMPDLTVSEELMAHIEIIQKSQLAYVVASDVNDTKIKAPIMEIFGLNSGQVHVTSRCFI